MPTRLITPPAALAVSLASAKANLRIDDDAHDPIITAWLLGIIAHAEHYTGLAFVNQAWRVTLDAFPDEIELPAPVSSVTSVKYVDETGTEKTLAQAAYTVDAASRPGRIVPAYGKEWPATRDQINAVTVDVVAGFGASPDDVPGGIRTYILAKLAEQYDGEDAKRVANSYIDRLLDPYKVWA